MLGGVRDKSLEEHFASTTVENREQALGDAFLGPGTISEEGTTNQEKCNNNTSTSTSRTSNLCDIGDDSLSTVISFLSPSDIVKCASVCRHLRAFCKEDRKVWLPICERRWGTHTAVQKWGQQKIRFKILHTVLTRLENLVGFWRGVEHGGRGSLVTFEWGLHFVTGFRVLPAWLGCYGVRKVPFLWIGVSQTGRTVCFLDPREGAVVVPSSVAVGSSPAASKESPSESRESLIQKASALDNEVRNNPFSVLGPDWDLERVSSPSGLVVVGLHFVGTEHIVMEDLQPSQYVGKRSLTEAAMVASFGSNESLAAAAAAAAAAGGGSAGGSRSGSESPGCSSSDSGGHGLSPQGSFQYEMFQFLASKVASQGGERAQWRQRRREKERRLIQGRRACEPEHFVKIWNTGPTPSRPLQGLWKGICDSMGLDFLLLLYNDQGGIVCRRVGECRGTTAQSGSVCWTANADCMMSGPLPDLEQDIFNSRQRIWPKLLHGDVSRSSSRSGQEMAGKPYTELDEEVVGMLCTNSMMGLDFGSNPREVENLDGGRVWLYASGRFGFGLSPSNGIVDYRPICSPTGLLLDVLD